ncbi:MAG: hypothetical protein ACO1RX_08960 [Candidatus Sericytochromatia bacterium]
MPFLPEPPADSHEEFLLFAGNYRRFLREVMPRLEQACTRETLGEIHFLSRYYATAFAGLLKVEPLAEDYLASCRQLATTVAHLLGNDGPSVDPR